MYKTKTILLPKKAERIFIMMLSFYPKQYRKRFGHEMLLVFKDLCNEELEKNASLTFGFWVIEILDISKSIVQEHITEIRQKGIKTYLQQTLNINTYNVVSIFLLLPVILMIGIEFVSRIIQGDLTHYNRPVYAFFSHSFLYWPPVLITWVILFPILAMFISVIPLVTSLIKRNIPLFSWVFVQKNIFGFAIFLFVLGFIALIKLHDFMPCMFYGVTHFGFGQLHRIVSVCENA